jgi:hypothetical protein
MERRTLRSEGLSECRFWKKAAAARDSPREWNLFVSSGHYEVWAQN